MSTYHVTKFDIINGEINSLSAEDILVADITGVTRAAINEAKREVREGGTAELFAEDGTYYQLSPAGE